MRIRALLGRHRHSSALTSRGAALRSSRQTAVAIIT